MSAEGREGTLSVLKRVRMRRELDTTRAIQSIGTNIVIFEFFDDQETADQGPDSCPVGCANARGTPKGREF